jgi:tripartite-type tricarboxylate transporter receptor subunit TctC
MLHLFTAIASVFAALVTGAAPADAQTWPARPVKIIVPSPPGDGSDTAARLIGEKLSAALGQPFVVENMPGSGGVIGTQAAVKAPADGYTLIMGNAGSHGINAAIFPKLSYDPIGDFAAVSMIFRAPNIFVAAPTLGVKSLAELIALAKSRSDPLNYASGGNGSSAHLNAEYLKLLAKIQGKHVPYRGASPALNDIVAGHVQFMSVNLPPALQLVKTGKIVPLAVTSAKRSSQLPDVPTVAESGFPGYETIAWFGLLAPKATPADVITRLHGAIVKACAEADIRSKLEALGGEVVCNPPAEFGAYITNDVKRWKEVANEAKIRLEQQ